MNLDLKSDYQTSFVCWIELVILSIDWDIGMWPKKNKFFDYLPKQKQQ